jgi:GTPase
VINKIDRAAAETLRTLQVNYPDAAFISARTGKGIEQLRATIESMLPRPEIQIRALVPYERGDLVNRIHQTGEFLTTEHLPSGTLVVARVSPALAAELAPYELVSTETAPRD